MASRGAFPGKGLVIFFPLFLLLSSPVLRHTASRSRVYSGQYFLLSSWLSCVRGPHKTNWVSLPSFEGFWAREVPPVRRTQFLKTGGGGCWGYHVNTWMVTPMKAGTYRVGGGKLRVEVDGREYLLSGNYLRIKVLPVPPGTMWTGALSLGVETDPVSGRVDLRVEVEGDPSLVPNPEISLKSGEVLLTGTSERMGTRGKFFGEKKFSYIARERVEGLVFSYRVFDPSSRKLRRVSSPEVSLRPRLLSQGELVSAGGGAGKLPLSLRPGFWAVVAVLFLLSMLLAGLSLVLSRPPSARARLRKVLAGNLPPEDALRELSLLLKGSLREEVDRLRFSPEIEEEEFKALLDKIRERLK